MTNKHLEDTLVRCQSLNKESLAKLRALAEFSRQSFDDIASIVLERGIEEAWQGYRQNPKHEEQIKKWEKENGQGNEVSRKF